MATSAPPSITAPPEFPALGDATYNIKAYTWANALPTVATQIAAVAANVKANADDAATSASTATTQAATATAKAGLTADDRVQTGLDRVQTGLDRAAAAASAVQASKLNLGNKSTPPTVDNQGDALLAGATYYDTTLNKWRVWTGSAWGDGVSAIAGVSEINGASGAVTIKSVAGQSLVGGGDVVIPASNVQTFTATGTLTDGMVVALRSDGTVEPVVQVAATSESTGIVTTFDATALSFVKSCACNSGQVAVIYKDSSQIHWVAIGTVTGTAVVFGTPVQVDATGSGGRDNAIAYDSINGKLVVTYFAGVTRYAKVGTVSGTGSGGTVSFGTRVAFGTSGNDLMNGCFSLAAGKVVICYLNASNYASNIVGTVSGDSISFGAENVVGTDTSNYPCCTYNATTDKVVTAWVNSSSYSVASVGTISGTTISNGTTSTNFCGSSVVARLSICSHGGSVYVAFQYPAAQSIYVARLQISGTALVVPGDGTNISNTSNSTYCAIEAVSDQLILISAGAGASAYTYRTILSPSTLAPISQAALESAAGGYYSVCIETTSRDAVIFWQGASSFGKSAVYHFSTRATTNANNFIGISKSAVTNAAAQVATIGAKVTNQTGLTPGAVYYLTDTGTLSTTPNNRKIGKATAATDLIIDTDDVSSGAWVLLSTVTAAGSATVDIEQTFSDAFDEYRLVATGVVSSASTPLRMLFKIDGAYRAIGQYYYGYLVGAAEGSGNGVAYAEIASMDSSANCHLGFEMALHGPATYKHPLVDWRYSIVKASARSSGVGGAMFQSTPAGLTGGLTGVRLYPSTGVLVAGTFRLYGIKK